MKEEDEFFDKIDKLKRQTNLNFNRKESIDYDECSENEENSSNVF